MGRLDDQERGGAVLRANIQRVRTSSPSDRRDRVHWSIAAARNIPELSATAYEELHEKSPQNGKNGGQGASW